ncbi:hypothetical protein BKA69DRAFT_1083618 [Paraphysoderma sedebokerense]|nr:hypothetical protein BKA69DRAFT_1083618 [Paraphysoderma sedebokerense]
MSPSFAEAELQKYGWKSGDGLGKERSGIKKAIRVNVKNDTNGLGKDNDRYEFQWWDHIYNKSTSNIVIHKDDGGVRI